MKQRRTTHPSPGHAGRRHAGAFLLAVLTAGLAIIHPLASAHGESAFPFGRELTAEVAPMPDTQRQPTLDIDDKGLAELDLWCANVKARLVVVADTITVLIGPKTERPCPPEQVRADAEILAGLAEVTNWRLEEDILVLTGGPATLRFRLQTN
jgi:heat shock protein HslJ